MVINGILKSSKTVKAKLKLDVLKTFDSTVAHFNQRWKHSLLYLSGKAMYLDMNR